MPILRVRAFLREHGDHAWGSDALGGSFEPGDADQLRMFLLREGYIEAVSGSKPATYSVTLKGRRLAKATAAGRVLRATADAALAKFLVRCEAVRSQTDFLFTVQKAILFGSMLSDVATVSDVDIAIELRAKEQDQSRHNRLMREQSAEAVAQGRHFSSFIQELDFPRARVYRFLKDRSRVLQFTEARDAVLLTTPTRLIFEDPAA